MGCTLLLAFDEGFLLGFLQAAGGEGALGCRDRCFKSKNSFPEGSCEREETRRTKEESHGAGFKKSCF